MDASEFDKLVAGRKSEQASDYIAGKKNTSNIVDFVGKRNAGFDLVISEFSSEIDCGKECSHCCHLYVDVMAFEVVAIHQFIRTQLSNNEQSLLIKKIEECSSELKSMSIEDEKQLVRRCPLLDDKDKCSIYAIRPQMCAGMVSPKSSLCEEWKNTGSNDVEIETPGKVGVWRVVELQASKAIALENGDSANTFSLVRALNALFNNPRLIQRWKNSRTVDLGPIS